MRRAAVSIPAAPFLPAFAVILGALVAGAPGAGVPAAAAAPRAPSGEIGSARTPRPPDVDALLAYLDDLYRSTSSIATIEITVISPHTTRTLRVKAWTRGQDDALIVIQAPPREAGTATLRVGRNLWNYLPRIARTIRVPASMMLGSWMGTDFTNDDLVKESSLEKDYVTTVDRRSESPPGWWLTLRVKPDVVGLWSKIEMLVGDDRLPIEERHYDRRGRLARVLRYDDVETMGGRRLPTHFTLTPTDEPGKRTELRYLSIDFEVKLPDDTFSLSRLEQNR
jgi:outer membrane lipoprotein-sorting protein